MATSRKNGPSTTSATSLPQPNPFARTNLIFTGRGRQIIVSKLDRIRLDEVKTMDNLPLSEVVKWLDDQAKRRDPEGRGINFIIAPNADTGAGGPAGPVGTDPATGLPMAPQGAETVDMNTIGIRISPALHDIRLADFLDIIVKVADKPHQILHRRLRRGVLAQRPRNHPALLPHHPGRPQHLRAGPLGRVRS